MWLGSAESSLAVIPLGDDRIDATRKLRKALRDQRDRQARQSSPWKSLAMAGLASDDQMMLLIRHDGIPRSDVYLVLAYRWRSALITDAGHAEPSSAMSVSDAVTLAVARRGIEPIRIFVPAQLDVAVSPECWADQPMPFVF